MVMLNRKFLLENYYGNKASWISPFGKIVEVPRRHITNILDNPEQYGYTKNELTDTYKKFNEPIGHEGKAREEIMTNLINKGWIRIRWNPKQFTWIVQVSDITKKVKDYMQSWSKEMLSNSDLTFSTVYILPIKAGLSPSSHSLNEISKDILYNESDNKFNSKYILEFVESFSKLDKIKIKKI